MFTPPPPRSYSMLRRVDYTDPLSANYYTLQGVTQEQIEVLYQEEKAFEEESLYTDGWVLLFFLNEFNELSLLTKAAGNCGCRASAIRALYRAFEYKSSSWHTFERLNLQVMMVNQATGSTMLRGQAVPDIACYHSPDRRIGNSHCLNPNHPPLIIDVEWDIHLLQVLNKVMSVYFHPLFVGPSGSTVDEVWVLILHSAQQQEEPIVPQHLLPMMQLQTFPVAASTPFIWPAARGTVLAALPAAFPIPQHPLLPFLVVLSREPALC